MKHKRNQESYYVTKDYGMFVSSDSNRPEDKNHVKQVRESMRKYGFLGAFPIMVKETGNGKFYIIDGQHRFLAAKELGIPVKYHITKSSIDIPEVNNTQKRWKQLDYVKMYANKGNNHYLELLVFSQENKLPVSTAAMLLMNESSYYGVNISRKIKDGTFYVGDKTFAKECMWFIYKLRLFGFSNVAKSLPFTTALVAVMMLNIDVNRMRNGVERKGIEHFSVQTTSKQYYIEKFQVCYNWKVAKTKKVYFGDLMKKIKDDLQVAMKMEKK